VVLVCFIALVAAVALSSTLLDAAAPQGPKPDYPSHTFVAD